MQGLWTFFFRSFTTMPERAPRARPKARAKAKGRPSRAAQQLAQRTATSNARRDARQGALRALNTLADEIGAPSARICPKSASNEAVERFVRTLQNRVRDEEQLGRFRLAAKTWSDAGGIFSADVVTEEQALSAFVCKHRVLHSVFKLKSKGSREPMHPRMCCRRSPQPEAKCTQTGVVCAVRYNEQKKTSNALMYV